MQRYPCPNQRLGGKSRQDNHGRVLWLPLPQHTKSILSILFIHVQPAPTARCYHSLIMFDPRFNKGGGQ